MIRLDTATILANVSALRVPREAWPPFWQTVDVKTHGSFQLDEWRVENRGAGWGVFSSSGASCIWCLCQTGGWEENRRNNEDFFRTGRWPTLESAMRAACIAASLYPDFSPYGSKETAERWKPAYEAYHRETQERVSELAGRLRVARSLHAANQLLGQPGIPEIAPWCGGWAGIWPEARCELRPVRCCERAGEYNGYGSDGPLIFTCGRHCGCHD